MMIAAATIRASFVVGVLGLMVVAVSASAQVDDKNCADFDTQADVHQFLAGNPEYPPKDLDDDLDGIPCEALPAGDGETSTSTTASTVPLPELGTFDGLRVKAERRQGYERPNVNYDRQQLLGDSLAAHTCYLSVADKICHASADDVEVDHQVALAEAWDSRPDEWTLEDLKAFGEDASNLWLMTTTLNQLKSDHDIADWVPPVGDQVCPYVERYVQTKRSHDLSVDTTEVEELEKYQAACAEVPGEASGIGGGADSEASGATEAGGVLPFTGPQMMMLVVFAGVALVIGVALLYVSRMRA